MAVDASRPKSADVKREAYIGRAGRCRGHAVISNVQSFIAGANCEGERQKAASDMGRRLAAVGVLLRPKTSEMRCEYAHAVVECPQPRVLP
jgi:hypothetical protein